LKNIVEIFKDNREFEVLDGAFRTFEKTLVALSPGLRGAGRQYRLDDAKRAGQPTVLGAKSKL
jgi:hypothetical protein